jgi:heterogeneous nuclear ribonucleoprotein A1/A3
MDQAIHKTKVFFENLSLTTTTNCLMTYLSKGYRVQTCRVPSESVTNRRNYEVILGLNKGFGWTIFSDEANVTKLMKNCPHRIDGKEVEIYRSVPNRGSLREKKGVKNLIVFAIHDKLSRSDLEQYFGEYGMIDNIDMNHGKIGM